MARPQFSLFRLMGAVSCCAVALAAWSWGERHPSTPPIVVGVLIFLIMAMPGLAAYVLSGRLSVGLYVALAAALLLLIYGLFGPAG